MEEQLKTIGYLIFAGFYYLFRLFCAVKPKKVFGIMTHDGSRDGNVSTLVEYLREQKEGYSFHYIKKSERNRIKSFHILKGKVSFFVVKPYHLATSEFILLDNVFLPMAYIKLRKNVRVIQLWHGTGTIKRFGQDVNTGHLKALEKRANSRITHLIVNSEDTKQLYAGAFGISPEKVYTYGLPRTDLFFNEIQVKERVQAFYKRFPQLAGKRLILYAPTFRDNEREENRSITDINILSDKLPSDYVILLRLHPFIAEAYNKEEQQAAGKSANVVSVSSYPDINTLLLAADCLITDYSSVIFEYCLLQKPMIFYAYDLEEFSSQGRGFYHTYEEYVPGPVVKNIEELVGLLKNNHLETDKIRDFINLNYIYLDGKASERIYNNIFKAKI
jgi:CDP-ribitol ribitolphosphotransferase